MARVSFIETIDEKLDSLPIVNGQLIYTTDTQCLYRDTSTERINLTNRSKDDTTLSMEEDTILVINTSRSDLFQD